MVVSEKPVKGEDDGAQKLVEGLTDTLKRVQAEFENYKKRVEREREKDMDYARGEVLAGFLPFYDSLENAEKQLAAHGAPAKELHGFGLVKKQFSELMAKNGVSAMECIGKKFDTGLHEVLLRGKDAKQADGIVLEELEKGFMFKDKVLRTAKVKVNKLVEDKR